MIGIQKYALMAATLLALAACTNDEVTAPADGGAPETGAVRVNAAIGSPLKRVNTEGDGGRFTYTDVNSSDMIYVENLGEGKVAGRDKGCYRLQADGKWLPCDADGTVNSSLYLRWGEGASNRFRGVYPATAADGFTLPTDQSTPELLRSADYMTCEDEEPFAMPPGGTISLGFAHRMAKVTAMLTFNNQYMGDEDIEAVEFRLSDGTTTVTACPTGTTAEGARTFTAILTPSAYADPSLPFCTVVIGNDTLVARVPAGGLTLAEGKAHTLNLRVGKDKVEMGTMRVNEWGSTVELEDNVADELAAKADPATHTIRTTAEGLIAENPDVITEAMGTEGILKVVGPMNQADMNAISANKNTITELDLSGATGKIANTRNAFLKSASLTKVKLGSNVTTIDGNAFYDCANLAEVDLSECANLERIEDYTFSKSGITSLKLPENGKLYFIGGSAFSYTKIQTVSIPATIESLSGYIFWNCTSLTQIIFQGTEPPTMADGYDTFADCIDENTNSDKTIYLPNVAAATEAWTDFFAGANGWTIKYGEGPTANP